MKYNEVHILNPQERNKIRVGLIGNSISIQDDEDLIMLSDDEAIKLLRLLS